MKQIKLKVEEDGVIKIIEISFVGDIMPETLDDFIKEHIGGRPKDRK